MAELQNSEDEKEPRAPDSQSEAASDQQEEKGETIAEIQARLGSFEPPPDFKFEAEFAPPVPRPIPRYIKEGRYHRSRAINLNIAFGIAVFCLLFAQHHFVINLGYYFLPLGYLEWIGWTIFALSIPFLIHFLFFPGKLVYVKKGEPIPMRILGFNAFYGGTQEMPRFGYSILADCINPTNNTLEARWFNTELLDLVSQAPRYQLGVKQGDYLTGVYLPGKFANTINIYDLLQLTVTNNSVLVDGEKLMSRRKLRDAIIGISVVGGVLFLLLTFCYYGFHFFPFEEEIPFTPLAISSVLGGLIIGIPSLLLSLRRRSSNKNPNASNPWAIAFLGFFGGVMLGLLGPLTLNSVLDFSEPDLREVRVSAFWQTTHKHIVRTYNIEYEEIESHARRKHSSNVGQMERFYGTMAGILEVKPGRFGMEWPARLLPVEFVQLGLGEDKTHARKLEMTNRQTKDVQVMIVDLRVDIDGVEFTDLSPELRDHAWKTVEKDGFAGGAIKVKVYPLEEGPPASEFAHESPA